MGEDMKLVAQRIAELREIFDYTEEEMARDAGVPLEVYRDYESNGENIPISVLYHISQKFGVDMSEILTGKPARLDSYEICRRGQGRTIERFEGYHYEDLAPMFARKVMEPLLVTLYPGEAEKTAILTHSGQEFNLVLEGTVSVMHDGREHVLQAGDAIYFDPGRPHSQKAIGNEKARFLTVITE